MFDYKHFYFLIELIVLLHPSLPFYIYIFLKIEWFTPNFQGKMLGSIYFSKKLLEQVANQSESALQPIICMFEKVYIVWFIVTSLA